MCGVFDKSFAQLQGTLAAEKATWPMTREMRQAVTELRESTDVNGNCRAFSGAALCA